ncbi:M20 family metallo-hydrolase [Streptomyces sp. NPDC013157]|uniref:M20 family metallo-hydrolase n=1 Tax=Streptomyces sp. NPDC013157 TaxID=3364861 RepID=UPI003685CA94
MNRQALTNDDFRGRRFLIDLARGYGATAHQDTIGNLFFRVEGSDPHALPVVTGSHADSQPTGGKLDGAYGVCAAIEVLAALRDSGVSHRRPVEAVIWTNEEGCRFPPGSMGASAFTDPGLLAGFLRTADKDGITVEEELSAVVADFSDVPSRPLGAPLAAFVEAHIEQGPILEAVGIPVGVVRGIQGTRWFEVETTGVAAHAGSTPKGARDDALRKATAIASDVYRLFADGDDNLRLTIGRMNVGPGSINVIPERVSFSVDLRHPETTTLESAESRLRSIVASQDGATIARVMEMPPTPFDEVIQRIIADAARLLDIPAVPIDSGAFHDSLHLAGHAPTGMVFVPSRDGLSHNPKEDTDLTDLATGTRVLAATVLALAND